MAFCNSCGTTMETGAKFCPKCGAAASASAVPTATPTTISSTPGTPAKGGSALKIILIILAIIVGIALLGMGTCAFFVHRAYKNATEHIHDSNGRTKIESPFGNIESSQDAAEAISDLGVAVYPGAEVVKGSSSTSTIGSMHTATAEFNTSDSSSTVADFYKTKMPNANFMSSGDKYTIIAGEKGNLTTISIEPDEGKTKIHIAKIRNAPGSGVTSN